MSEDEVVRYFSLLLDAFQASDAMDGFDLKSDDAQSVAAWRALVKECNAANAALVSFVLDNATELSAEFNEHQ